MNRDGFHVIDNPRLKEEPALDPVDQLVSDAFMESINALAAERRGDMDVAREHMTRSRKMYARAHEIGDRRQRRRVMRRKLRPLDGGSG